MAQETEQGMLNGEVSRRKMLKTAAIGGGTVAAAFAGIVGVDVASAAPAGDDPQTIINLAATAESLAVTAFYSIITASSFYAGLPAVYQNYLKSALTQEQVHYDFLVSSGAKPLANQFYFPTGILNSLALYVYTTDVLEGSFVAAYMASIRRFAELGVPQLAWTAAAVMGIECEHKALNRAMGISLANSGAGSKDPTANSPTREPVEPATVYNVSQLVPVFGPILMGGTAPASAGALIAGVNFGTGPVTMPAKAQVNAIGNTLTATPLPISAFRVN